jgi:ArsR family transcriptional regulator
MRQIEYNKRMAKPCEMARLFVALGNETRLRLLNLMAEREICVCELVEVLRLPQPKISQHLACLRSVGIVCARREGKWMHYRMVTPAHREAAQVLQATLAWMQTDKQMLADRNRHGKSLCLTAIQQA